MPKCSTRQATMRHIPDQHLARLNQEVSLAHFCQDYGIELRLDGDRMIGACPFHVDPGAQFRGHNLDQSVEPPGNLRRQWR